MPYTFKGVGLFFIGRIMTYPVQYVNEILEAASYAVQNRVDLTDPRTAGAHRTLEKVDNTMQAVGYWFNKEYNVTLPHLDEVNGEGRIPVPSTSLGIEFNDNRYIVLGGYIRDVVLHTYMFSEDLVVKSIVYKRNLADCEVQYRDACIAKAARVYFAKVDGEAVQLKELTEDANTKEFELRQLDMKKKNANALNNPIATRLGLGMRSAPSITRFGTVVGGYQWQAKQ